MYKLCKTEQSAARQRQLEQGLLQAMYTQDYEDISISDLCDRMGVPRKSFYRYFSNKDGALFALLDHTLMEFEQTSGTTASGNSGAIGDLERFFLWKGQIGCILHEDFSEDSFGPRLAERVGETFRKLMPLYDFFNRYKTE